MSEQDLGWTGDQWERIRQAVHDEALRARVAASFLPLYGPLPGGTETVPKNLLGTGVEETSKDLRLEVNDHEVLRLASVSVNVYLKGHMAADPELAAAIMLFRRAADIIARIEDAIIFNGKHDKTVEGVNGLPAVYTLGGAETYEGLLEQAGNPASVELNDGEYPGAAVFNAIVEAIGKLEGSGHYRPYACVLGAELFAMVHKPVAQSMVLARDSILPMIEGPLVRSSVLPPGVGLLISLQGEPVEIVVPGDISVRYLQTTMDGKHAFRVSQRFVLRVKDPSAIAAICK